jgi:hypothetical protein
MAVRLVGLHNLETQHIAIPRDGPAHVEDLKQWRGTAGLDGHFISRAWERIVCVDSTIC